MMVILSGREYEELKTIKELWLKHSGEYQEFVQKNELGSVGHSVFDIVLDIAKSWVRISERYLEDKK